MKLYSVSVNYTLDMVIASDEPPDSYTVEDAAETLVNEIGFGSALGREGRPGTVKQITGPQDIPFGWSKSPPLGEHPHLDGNRTCQEIIDSDPGILLEPFGEQLTLPGPR